MGTVGSYNPNAHEVNNYYTLSDPASGNTPQPAAPETVVVLGGGFDAALGMPLAHDLIPGIADFMQTDTGKTIDEQLRKKLKQMRFHYDTFVDKKIDELASDIGSKLQSIRSEVREELRNNPSLDDNMRKTAKLIVRIFTKIIDIKSGAEIDEETENLVRELYGMEISDDTFIDFTKISYTDTFKLVIKSILNSSIRDSGNPVLRHIYHNLLDIESLLAQYFYGFFTGKDTDIKKYIYISWTMWAYLVDCEQRIRAEHTADTPVPLLDALRDSDCAVISFNYTTFAREACPETIYFHGNLLDYVDIENKNDLHFDSIGDIDLTDFFTNQLPQQLNVDDGHRMVPIPSFMPPLKLKPVISKQYVATWYRSAELLHSARRIVILGCSFANPDDYFCDMLRDNRDARIVIIDKDIDNAVSNVCHIFQLNPNRFTPQTIGGITRRLYDNRIEVIGSDIASLDLSQILNNS